MKNPKKILIIIQRSNGDVFLSLSLIEALYDYFNFPQIDLLVNDDTLAIAKLLPNVNFIHTFSYQKKHERGISQEWEIISRIYNKYDLSINLTASDRSVIYAILAGKKSISAVEKNNQKSWWKKSFLTSYYFFDETKHILCNNLEPLHLLKIKHRKIQKAPKPSKKVIAEIKNKLDKIGIKEFVIFHPSAQYYYKIYPQNLRNELLKSLSSLGIPILITGSNNKIDLKIQKEIPKVSIIFNFIGKTSLEEYFVLSELSSAYVGMDTLNMHIAAAHNKPIFAIFGSTNLSMWSPWSNILQKATKNNRPIQSYDNITIFQSSIPCEVCGLVGCGNNHGKDDFHYFIKPEDIFIEIEKWYKNARF